MTGLTKPFIDVNNMNTARGNILIEYEMQTTTTTTTTTYSSSSS